MINLTEEEKYSSYAMNVAIYGYFNHLTNDYESSSSSTTTTLYSTDMTNFYNNGMMHVITDRLSTYLNDQNVFNPEGTYNSTATIIGIINQFAIRKSTNKYLIPNKLNTADIIMKVNSNSIDPDLFCFDDYPDFGLELYQILLQVFKIYPDLILNSNITIQENLKFYIERYIDDHFFKDEQDRYSAVIHAREQVYKEAQSLYSNGQDINLDKFVLCFLYLLENHLELFYENDLSQVETTKQTVNKLREQGNNLMSNYAYGQAIKAYTQALELCPKSFPNFRDIPQLHTNRAIAFIGLNCVPEAIDDLNIAVATDRTFTPAWTQLGYCHLYMGSGLLALECYLVALRTCVGDIIPFNFPQDLISQYRDHKLKTILPQFIERLSSAIALAEKRAYQQNQPEREIKRFVSEVRKILAQLRATGPEEDRESFTYLPLYRDSTLRTMSERANSQRPNILTPEVSQNILARSSAGGGATGTEGGPTVRAIPVAASIIDTPRNETARDGRGGGSPEAARDGPGIGAAVAAAAAAAAQAAGMDQTAGFPPGVGTTTTQLTQPNFRDLLNNFGDLMEGRIPPPPAAAGATGGRNTGGTGNRDGSPAAAIAETIIQGVGQVLPDGIRGMISSMTGNGQNARVFIDGREIPLGGGSSTNNNNNANANANAHRGANRNDGSDDVDMGDDDVPNDLD